jgi:hypothetical protein
MCRDCVYQVHVALKAERCSGGITFELFDWPWRSSKYFSIQILSDCLWGPLGPLQTFYRIYKRSPYCRIVNYLPVYLSSVAAHSLWYACNLNASVIRLSSVPCQDDRRTASGCQNHYGRRTSLVNRKKLCCRRSGKWGEGALSTVPSQQDGAVTGPQYRKSIIRESWKEMALFVSSEGRQKWTRAACWAQCITVKLTGTVYHCEGNRHSVSLWS